MNENQVITVFCRNKALSRLFRPVLTLIRSSQPLSPLQKWTRSIPFRISEFFLPVGPFPKPRFRWTLWFFKNEKGKQWKDNCRPVTTFSTVEDFWAIYNHIQVFLEHVLKFELFFAAPFKTANWVRFHVIQRRHCARVGRRP